MVDLQTSRGYQNFWFFETAVLPGETAILGGETAVFNFENFSANLRAPLLQRISSNSTMDAALGRCSVKKGLYICLGTLQNLSCKQLEIHCVHLCSLVIVLIQLKHCHPKSFGGNIKNGLAVPLWDFLCWWGVGGVNWMHTPFSFHTQGVHLFLTSL